MTWPNFLVIGAAKSGTTSLYHYLKQHPQIYMSPVKEPEFFAFCSEQVDESSHDQFFLASIFRRFTAKPATNLNDYLNLFKGVKDEKAIGEASTHYLCNPQAPARIHQFIAHAKLIAILRNPIDRAYSDFLMLQHRHDDPTNDFLKSIDLENLGDYSPPWASSRYLNYGFYDTQLERFFKYFPASHLRVFLFEDLRNPIALLQEIFRFLEVDDTFQPQVAVRYNTAMNIPRNPLGRLIIKATPASVRHVLKYVLPPPVFRWYMAHRQGHFNETQCPPEAREELRPIFRDHILRLQDMIQRDLAHWLT